MRMLSRVGARAMIGFIIACFVIGFFYEAHAQARPGFEGSRYGVASAYKYTEPGDIPMYVHIWGYVFRPGLYELPVGTKMSTALSLSGGFSLGARQWSEERIITLELFQSADNSEAVSIFKKAWIDSQIQLTQDFTLTDGNFLIIDAHTKRKFNWRDALAIVGATASVAIAIERIVSLK